MTRAGGDGAISSGPRSASRAWARAIYDHHRDDDALDGVLSPSSHIPVARSVALWERADDALPSRPSVNEPLSHPSLRPSLEAFAAALGLDLVVTA